VFFWFIGLAFVVVAIVFDSPSLDYRLVMAGAVAPMFEHLWGGPWITHTLLWPVGLMTAIMVVARGRRLTQRRWLGLAIGFFMHLVLDGSWARTSLFWWPGFGVSIADADTPSLPGVAALVLMEIVGLVALGWAVRRWGLMDEQRRRRFLSTGNLERSFIPGGTGTC